MISFRVEGESMRGLIVAFMSIFLATVLFGSDVKLIEPVDAIRLIGDKRVVFVSGENNDTYYKHHILGSVSMPIDDLYHLGDKCASPQDCFEKVQAYIQNKGISNSQMIIVYDDFVDHNVTSVYDFFSALNHADLRVLTGGLAGIKALDPNQQVLDTLQAEQEVIEIKAKKASLAGNRDEESEFEAEAENIQAKMNLLKSQLLVHSDEEKKRKIGKYLIDTEKINSNNATDKENDR